MCAQPCYRQEAHEKDRVWQLLADEQLPETIAAWTVDLTLAKTFKGGVPPEGLQGVIFALEPEPDQVVINLVEVYADPAFQAACAAHQNEIPGFPQGIGKYGAGQSEVVLEIGVLGTDRVLSYGGYSSPMEELAVLDLGRMPTAGELEAFKALTESSGVQPGAWWLSEGGTRGVLARMAPRLPALRAKKV